MEICKAGIWFNHYGDYMLYRWPWKRTHLDRKFRSGSLAMEFSHLREYWQHLGTVETSFRKLRISSLKDEDLILCWVRINLGQQHAVVLTHINVQIKPGKFWIKIPHNYRPHFLKDVVVLHCKQASEVYDLCDSIESRFATAYGFVKGELVRDNLNENNPE